jgi:large subunit ribosomal protein L24
LSKILLKKGDKVQVIAGKDKGKQGKVLIVDRDNNKIIVEGVNMITKHQKPRGPKQGGIINKEAPLHVSNVMYVHNGKPVRLGVKIEVSEKDGKKVINKKRIARPSGDVIN